MSLKKELQKFKGKNTDKGDGDKKLIATLMKEKGDLQTKISEMNDEIKILVEQNKEYWNTITRLEL